MHVENKIQNEIRKEFQLDRIVLFSDAVFAIVITLMAIEIRLPHNSIESFSAQLLSLIPVILAYAVSFAFIGHLWYQHLHFFGLLKDFDRGLIVRNLLMLFCIGFFPFSATLIASGAQRFLSVFIYWLVLFSCKASQLNIQYYILVKKPELCVRSGLHEEILRFKKTRIAMFAFSISSILVALTMLVIRDPELKPWAWWWFTPMPFVIKYLQKRIKVNPMHVAKRVPAKPAETVIVKQES
jgi:uncharacterized membrane protein